MKRGEPLADLQKRFGAPCVTDTTDWDSPGNHFEIWTSDHHEFVDGVCRHCGEHASTPEDEAA